MRSKQRFISCMGYKCFQAFNVVVAHFIFFCLTYRAGSKLFRRFGATCCSIFRATELGSGISYMPKWLEGGNMSVIKEGCKSYGQSQLPFHSCDCLAPFQTPRRNNRNASLSQSFWYPPQTNSLILKTKRTNCPKRRSKLMIYTV